MMIGIAKNGKIFKKKQDTEQENVHSDSSQEVQPSTQSAEGSEQSASNEEVRQAGDQPQSAPQQHHGPDYALQIDTVVGPYTFSVEPDYVDTLRSAVQKDIAERTFINIGGRNILVDKIVSWSIVEVKTDEEGQ